MHLWLSLSIVMIFLISVLYYAYNVPKIIATFVTIMTVTNYIRGNRGNNALFKKNHSKYLSGYRLMMHKCRYINVCLMSKNFMYFHFKRLVHRYMKHQQPFLVEIDLSLQACSLSCLFWKVLLFCM